MQRPRTKARTARAVVAAALAALTLAGLVLAGLAASPASPASAATVPKTTLGIWIGAEDGGTYSTVAGQHPDIANYYLAWGQQWPAQFISQAEAAGATPYIEIEPWHAGPDWNRDPVLPEHHRRRRQRRHRLHPRREQLRHLLRDLARQTSAGPSGSSPGR